MMRIDCSFLPNCYVSINLFALLSIIILLFILFCIIRNRFLLINANLKKGVHDFNIIYKKYTEAVVEFEEEKAKFKAVFDNSPYSIAFNELDGSYIDVNNAFLTQWGVTLEQVVSVSEANYVFLGDEDKQRFYETLERDGRVTNMQTHIVRPDGSTSCVLFSSVLVTVFGKTVILSTAVDVTSIKEAEEKIKSWELKFDLTTAAANLAFYEYDVKNDSINWNGRLLEKLGYDSESMSGSMSVWSALLHPEDAEKTISLLEESLSRKTRYVVEYRIRCKMDHTPIFLNMVNFSEETQVPLCVCLESYRILPKLSGRRKLCWKSRSDIKQFSTMRPLGYFARVTLDVF